MASAADTALERLSQIERPVRLVAELALVVALALLAARLVWVIASPSESVAAYTERPLPSPMRGTSDALAITADRSLLATTNPFSQGVAEPVIENVPETSLNLKLIGLRMSTEGGDSGNAIIRTPNGLAENFSVGDELLGGVTLERILSDRVLINRDGASETLMLGGRGAGLSVISDDAQTVSPAAASVGDMERPTPVQSPETTITRQLDGPEVFFGSVTATPEMRGDTVIGYRLNPLGDGQMMRNAGLEPGDLLISINGTAVQYQDLTGLMDSLSAQPVAELEIDRNGTSQTVRLVFDE